MEPIVLTSEEASLFKIIIKTIPSGENVIYFNTYIKCFSIRVPPLIISPLLYIAKFLYVLFISVLQMSFYFRNIRAVLRIHTPLDEVVSIHFSSNIEPVSKNQ